MNNKIIALPTKNNKSIFRFLDIMSFGRKIVFKFQHSLDDKKMAQIRDAIGLKQNDRLEQFIKDGMNVNAVYAKEELTALIIATMLNSPSAIKILLHYKAKIDYINKDGVSALFTAITMNNIPLMKLLLSKKANPEITDAKGINALHLTVKNKSYEATKVLIDYGADLNHQSKSQLSLIILAIGSKDLLVRKLNKV